MAKKGSKRKKHHGPAGIVTHKKSRKAQKTHHMTGIKRKHSPSPKARKAYNKLIIKSYHRLKNVVAKHAPNEL
jgi:hypothetical protein